MASQRRVRLSFVVRRTQRLLVVFLLFVAFCLGAAYLFLLNRVSMQGYFLTKVSEEHLKLTMEEEQISAQIAHRETRKYLADTDQTQTMVFRGGENYLVMKPSFTAQSKSMFENSF